MEEKNVDTGAVLYISAALPARSETFVYREIFALRELGATVATASVNPGERELGRPELDELAAATIPVYGAGAAALARDAFLEVVLHPLRSAGTLALAVRDAVAADDVVGFGKRGKVLVQGAAALALARRIRPLGVVHVHAHMAHVPTTIAMYAARQLGITFSFTGHANDIFPNRALLREKIRRALFVSCISRWHRDFYASIHPRDEASLPVVRCGVDTAAEAYASVEPAEEFRILGVGRLVEKKGFDVLLEAAGLVAAETGRRLAVTIAGSGPEEARLRDLAARLPPSVRVELPGATDNRGVMELMARCDLFALPLRVTSEGDRDGIPVVLMEAMARGRCVLSGDLVTIRELVEDGVCGFLTPPGDARAVADRIAALMADRTLLEETGRRARAKIVAEFDVRANAALLLAKMREHGAAV